MSQPMRPIATGFKFLSILCFAAGVLAGCAENDATGRRQFTGLMPTSQEASVGAEENGKVVQQYGVYKNPVVTSYVTRVGQRVAAQSERKDVQYTFTVLDSPVENAFALPGGYIYITRGLLALINDESELAGVLAHEMGHVTARHSAERYSQQVVGSIGLDIVGAVIGGGAIANQALGVGANLYFSQYSQSQEYEADKLGVRYLAQAGYDPNAVSRMLTQLMRSEQLEKAKSGQGAQGGMPSLFSSHPPTAKRVQQSAELAAATGVSGGEAGHEAYLKNIHGLAYGTGADEGYVRKNRFIHPQLGISFTVPAGFAVTNEPERVVGKSKSGAAFVFDADNRSAGEDIGIYLTKWTKGKLDPRAVQPATVNGHPAATAEMQATTDAGPVAARLFAIAWDNTRVYRFTFLMPSGTSAAEQSALRDAAYSLQTPTSAEAATTKGMEILSYQASAGETVEKLASKMPFNDGLNVMRFRAINGLSDAEELKAGQFYKLIQ